MPIFDNLEVLEKYLKENPEGLSPYNGVKRKIC